LEKEKVKEVRMRCETCFILEAPPLEKEKKKKE
jgi:hypothetical protein